MTGVESTSEVGTVSLNKSGSTQLTSVFSTGSIGNVGFNKSGNVGLTGSESTSEVGNLFTGEPWPTDIDEVTIQSIGEILMSSKTDVPEIESKTSVITIRSVS